jgi:cell division septation protein DedD
VNSSSAAFEAQTEWLPDDASLIAVVREQGSGAWASGVAVGLADIVGRRRGRTFLANVGGDSRELDGVLDVAGGPGLTSALSGVTSIASIARSAPERSFTYLPGGESALPLSDLSRMPSFRRLLRKMSAGGGTLLLYVAEEDLGGRVAEAASDLRLSGCIALGSVKDVALELGAPLLARVEQPVRPDDTSATATTPEDGQSEAAETDRERVWMPRLAWAGGVLAVLWVAWQLGGSPGVDGSRASESADPPTETTSAQAAEEPPPVAEPPAWEAPGANYSVLVGSYVRFGDAEERRAALARSAGLFFVSPTPVRGRVYYRVFAGVFEDQSDALAAMERLVVDGHKEAVKLWDVRPVRLAHDLGTFDERAIADELVASLGEDGIPAYVLSESVDGSRFKVYAGAFESENAAAPLSELLASREVPSEFGPRSGLAP